MKNYIYLLLTSLVLFAAGSLTAQNGVLEIYNFNGDLIPDGTHLYKLSGDEAGKNLIATDTLFFKNTTDDLVYVKIRKIEDLVIEGSTNYFCGLGQCYPPFLFLTPHSYPLEAGATIDIVGSFVGDYNPGDGVGTSTVTYSFLSVTDDKQVLDSTTVTYHFSNTSITPYSVDGDVLYNNEVLVNCGQSELNGYAVNLHNHTTIGIDYKVEKEIISAVDGHDVYFKYGGVEYPAETNVSETVFIDANTTLEGDNGFIALFNPNDVGGNEILTTIKYHFIYALNDIDNDHVTLVYNPNGVGFNDLNGYSVSSPYPNPAISSFKVDYDLPKFNNASLRIYQSNGALIGAFDLTESKGSALIDTDNLTNGVYFYSIVVDGKALGVDKVVIQK